MSIMKRRKMFNVFGLLLAIVLFASACGSKMSMDTAVSQSKNDSGKADIDYDRNASTGSSSSPVKSEEKPSMETGFTNGNSLSDIDKDPVDMQDKIIRTFFLDIETMEFDSLITRLESEISRLGGYVENSKISGKSYYDNGSRYGNIVARIPSKNVDEFVNTVGENANIVSTQESSTNVSLEYIDAESRVKTLKIEQERLYAIMEKELNLENIIALESRLSEIRYELQNYESRLRYYDNQVAYSTVTMSIQEVIKFTPAVEIKQTVGTRIKNGFSNTIYDITEGFKNFFVWFVVNLPYLIIWGLITTAIVMVVRRLRKGKSNKIKAIAQEADNYEHNDKQQNDIQE